MRVSNERLGEVKYGRVVTSFATTHHPILPGSVLLRVVGAFGGAECPTFYDDGLGTLHDGFVTIDYVMGVVKIDCVLLPASLPGTSHTAVIDYTLDEREQLLAARARRRSQIDGEIDIMVEPDGSYVVIGRDLSIHPDDPRSFVLEHDTDAQRLPYPSMYGLMHQWLAPRKPVVTIECQCGWSEVLRTGSAMHTLRTHRCSRVERFEARGASWRT